MFARKDGMLVKRECICKCGKDYTQYMVSKRFVEILKLHGTAYNIFVLKAPKGYLPIWCIACERKALGEEHDRKWEDVAL